MGSHQNHSVLLEQSRTLIKALVTDTELDTEIVVTARILAPNESMGCPDRDDYPLVKGTEYMIESRVMNGLGQAFTDEPDSFTGKLSEVLDSDFSTSGKRALYVSVINALMNHFKSLPNSRHCRDDLSIQCGKEMAQEVAEMSPSVVGLIGYQPSFIKALAETFGSDAVLVTDLDSENIGHERFGITIMDGKTQTSELIDKADFILITSTTLVNGTFDAIYDEITRKEKAFSLYGITGAGLCRLFGMPNMCYYSLPG